jgi:hypothetical protein
MLERGVCYGGLSAESVDELAQLAEARGRAALRAVNSRAQELQTRDTAEGRQAERMSFGVYFLRTPDGDED